VKNLGRGFIAELRRERAENGAFLNLLDFLERMYGKDLNRRAVEALIKCGALDSFGHHRAEMLAGFERLLENVEKEYRNNISGQIDLFGGGLGEKTTEYQLPPMEELGLMQRLAMEKETCGLYLSGHPLSEYEEAAKALLATSVSTILRSEDMDGAGVSMLAVIQSRRTKITRNNDTMAFLIIEDKTGSMEAIVFPRVYAQYSAYLAEGAVVALRGRVKAGEEEEPQLTCDCILPVNAALEDAESFRRVGESKFSGSGRYVRQGRAGSPPQVREQEPQEAQVGSEAAAAPGKQGLYLKFPEEDSGLIEKASNVLFVFEGDYPVYFYFCDNKKYQRTPKTHWVAPNPTMLGELRKILGNGSVVWMK
jgi:DNA polymerase-3 subunit alpha